MANAARQQAQVFVSQLRERTDALFEGRLSDEEFARVNRDAWDAIQARPEVDAEVVRIFRQSLGVGHA